MTSLGIDQSRLDRIPAFLNDNYIAPGKLPCAQISVLRRDELVLSVTLGSANMETGEALRPDALFRIYSMTKPVTSVAFMQLVEEGRVGLEDPVHRYFPTWRNLAVYEGGEPGAYRTKPTRAPMRVIDLLRHTSGLTYDLHGKHSIETVYRQRGLGWSHGPRDMAAFIDGLSDLPLIASPGEVWNYSVATDVIGALIEKIADRPLGEVFRERIFTPLGMTDTDFHVPGDKAGRFVACYQADATGKLSLFDDPRTSLFLEKPNFESGGGGLVSTSADYMRFCQMLLGRGELDGVRIIAPKTLDLMTSNHIPGGLDLNQVSVSLFSEATYAGVGFGLGFAVTIDPAKTLLLGSKGEFFWGGMASTYFWVDPAEDLACVFMTQLLPSSAYPIRRQLRNMVYASLTN